MQGGWSLIVIHWNKTQHAVYGIYYMYAYQSNNIIIICGNQLYAVRFSTSKQVILIISF